MKRFKYNIGQTVTVHHEVFGTWTGQVVCRNDTGYDYGDGMNGLEYEVSNAPDRTVDGRWFPLAWESEMTSQ